jgi:hypothetical protein
MAHPAVEPHPASDAREQSLDARPALMHLLIDWIDAVKPTARAHTLAARVDQRHQVFRVADEEDVGLLGLNVARQALVGAAGDRRGVEVVPAEAEGAVARTRAVAQA